MRKLLGVILELFLIAVIFFSMLFISMEMGHHDCSGEECPVCRALEECINNLRSFGTACVIAVAVCVLLPYIVEKIQKHIEEVMKLNLISERVRLNY